MAKTIAGTRIEVEIVSREGVVYITESYVYKVFGGRTNPYDVLEMYKRAEAMGVPVSDSAKFTAPLLGDAGAASSSGGGGAAIDYVSGIRSKRAFGRFFQLSKPGGPRILINEISMMTNRGLLQMVHDGLVNAARAGLTDPQGFISINSNPPLTFIDVHLGSGPNPGVFEEAIEAARLRLEILSGR